MLKITDSVHIEELSARRGQVVDQKSLALLGEVICSGGMEGGWVVKQRAVSSSGIF
jgi:hypothetical protein